MQNFPEIKTNLLSGLTVALAMVPEAIAFALIAQVSPLTGLYAAILVCFITSVFGGRPGMVSGATGALAVVMVSLVVQHGPEYLFLTVILMGLLQIIFALFKLGKFIRMVPYPVMLGFVNGLAVAAFQHSVGPGHDCGHVHGCGCGCGCGCGHVRLIGVVRLVVVVVVMVRWWWRRRWWRGWW